MVIVLTHYLQISEQNLNASNDLENGLCPAS